jgi:hypothetical protein
MRKAGVAVAVTASIISATLLATQAQAVTLGGRTQLRAAMEAVNVTEPVFDYGCCPDCGCWRPPYSYYYRRYPPPYNYNCCNYGPPWRYFSYYDPGPFHDPEDLNWGYRTRWADGYSQY